jgi:hypothetical protein
MAGRWCVSAVNDDPKESEDADYQIGHADQVGYLGLPASAIHQPDQLILATCR